MTTQTPITELVTHSGGFHADELLSSVVLTRLYPGAKLVRTRDAQTTSPRDGRIIYDVGREYDVARAIFDHHQKNAPLRPDGRPYSSFGLIWHHFGLTYLGALQVPADHAAEIHARIDAEFVVPVDLMDNGALDPSVAGPLAGLTLPVLLETLKPVFDQREADADDLAFQAALPVARAFLEAAVRTKAAKARAEGIVTAAIQAAGPSRVLELPMGMPFRAAIEKAGADHILFVVHPRDKDWAINTIRQQEDKFENRADLPAAWAGLTDTALEAASGVTGATFCHNGRFIAVASTRAAAMQMADLAVQDFERQAREA